MAAYTREPLRESTMYGVSVPNMFWHPNPLLSDWRPTSSDICLVPYHKLGTEILIGEVTNLYLPFTFPGRLFPTRRCSAVFQTYKTEHSSVSATPLDHVHATVSAQATTFSVGPNLQCISSPPHIPNFHECLSRRSKTAAIPVHADFILYSFQWIDAANLTSKKIALATSKRP